MNAGEAYSRCSPPPDPLHNPQYAPVLFKCKRLLLGELCKKAVPALFSYFRVTTGAKLRPGVAAIIRKSEEAAGNLVIIEEECPKTPRRGWVEIIRKVYEVDLISCPQSAAG